MAITIKEIHVKTTIVRDFGAAALPDDVILRLKESILHELREEERKKMKKRNER